MGYRHFVGGQSLTDFGLTESHGPYVVQIYFLNRPTSPCDWAMKTHVVPADEEPDKKCLGMDALVESMRRGLHEFGPVNQSSRGGS